MDFMECLKEASNVKPSQNQIEWFKMERYAFVHFGVNTFTNREWGDGCEDEKIFDPKKIDCDQWAKVLKETGFNGMILTCKHHDGFCLWPSKFTNHCVKKIDVVKMASQACKKYGIKFGIYLSPWDRNSKYYGSEEYNDYYCKQLEELLCNYGKLFCVWWDNACGEGPSGKKQVYDFDRYISLVRKWQADAVIFNDYGPDIRWCGNEAGCSRSAEWSTVPVELCHFSKIQTSAFPLSDSGNLSFIFNSHESLGDLSTILYSKGLTFTPCETNTSIHKGWFYHEEENPKSLEELFKIYLNSAGNNSCLNLNIPPDKNGLFAQRDVDRLYEFNSFLKKEFSNDVTLNFWECDSCGNKIESHSMQKNFCIEINVPVEKIKYLEVMEKIEEGQRIESFIIYSDEKGGSSFPLYEGKTVGWKKICMLKNPFEKQNILLENSSSVKNDGKKHYLFFKVTAARGEALLKSIKVFS